MTDSPETADVSDADVEEAETETKVDPRDALVLVREDQVDAWFDRDDGHPGDFASLDTAIEHVIATHDADGERKDVKVDDLNKWVFAASGYASIFPQGEGGIVDLRKTAFAHLCARAKAPPKYLRSIPARYVVPALNWGIVNRSEGPALLRYAGEGELRAILSQRYALFDDRVVLPQLRVSLGAANLLDGVTTRVLATGLTTMMRLTIDGEAIALPNSSEIAAIALDYSNGEVGNRAVSLSPVVYFEKSKIAARGRGLRLRHLGEVSKIAEEFREQLPEVLAKSRKLRDQVVVAIDKAIGDVVAEAEKLRTFGLSIAEARDVLRALAQNAGVALPHDTAEWEEPLGEVTNVKAYDVFAAVAALGQKRSVDRRLELEEAAAKYLARAAK